MKGESRVPRVSFVADSETWGGPEVYPDVVLVNLVDPASNAAVVGAALDIAPTAATLHLGGDTRTGPARTRLAATYGGSPRSSRRRSGSGRRWSPTSRSRGSGRTSSRTVWTSRVTRRDRRATSPFGSASTAG